MIIRLLLTVIVSGAGATEAFAQHDAHQAAPSTAVDETLANCAQVQPVVQQLLDGASARLQAARLTNSAAGLRAAVDDLDAALRDLRAELAPCAKVESTDAHAGHAMPAANPTPPQSGKPSTSKPPAATKPAADPHAGHTMSPEATGAPATTVDPSQTNDAQKIEEWLKGYDVAFLAKDLDTLATFYHPDVTIYEGAGVNNGWADYRDRHLGPELKAFDNLEFGHSNRRVLMLGDRAAVAISEYFIKAKMKDRMLDNVGRETLVLEKQTDGGWKIRHSHTSGRARPQPK